MPCSLLFPVLLVALSLCAHAAPRLEVVGGTTRDLGAFGMGQYRGEFAVTNVGDGVLQITDGRSSCGCLIASSECRSLKPGDTGVLVWRMIESRSHRGFQSKGVSISTNDPVTPVVRVQFNWMCLVDLEIDPSSTNLVVRRDTLGNLWKGTLKLTNVADDTLAITPRVAGDFRGMRLIKLLSATPVRLAPGRTLLVSAVVEHDRAITDSLAYGSAYGLIRVETSGRSTPWMDVTVIPLH